MKRIIMIDIALSIGPILQYIPFISYSPCAFHLTLLTLHMISNTSLRNYLVTKSLLTLVSTGNTANLVSHTIILLLNLLSHIIYTPNLPANPGQKF